MPYPEAKVYSDGAHYIAIPHSTNPAKKRRKTKDEIIEVTDPVGTNTGQDKPGADERRKETGTSLDSTETNAKPCTNTRKITKKEFFDELYDKYLDCKKTERRRKILNAMLPFFKNEEKATLYVDTNIERRCRNLISRRVRMARKAYLQEFNYFVTFTYNGAIHTEESFRKSLRSCLKRLSSRRGWKYIGVWGRSPGKKRLHFHGMFFIPDGTMPGMLVEKRDYNTSTKRMQVSVQNTYFNENFGRSDFETIGRKERIGDMLAYIMKYIEKSGEKIVYSRGLPQYFISDILDDDVACFTGIEDRKLLLFDDFTCWDEGCYMGKVSPEVIAQMRKSN